MAQEAPGRHERKGMSLVELIQAFPDDKSAEDWFISIRWPDGIHCPHCGHDNVLIGAKHKTMPYQCRRNGCRKRFSVRVGTVMQGSNLGYQKWAIAIYLLCTSLKSVSSMKLHRDLHITQKSAWHLAHRIRKAFENQPGPFDGPAEADEVYIGGKLHNMPTHKRKAMRGRGTVGKAIVAGIKDRTTKEVAVKVVDRVDKATLQAFVIDHTAHDAIVYTDDFPAYRGLPRQHESVKHSVGEYVRGEASTNSIESFWSLLKRSYHGTFHHFSKKHLTRYVTEFATRANIRGAGTAAQMVFVAQRLVGKRLRYQDLIAD